MTPSTYKLSFQLYSTRNFPPQDDVLEGLAAMGYDAVEPWLPDFATDAKGFRKRIDNAGLECLGFHMPLKGLIEEPMRYIDIAHTLGDSPLMIPPYVVPEERPFEADGWRRIGEQLAKGAELAQANNLRVAWHNHDFEYRPLDDGSRPIDLMLEAAGENVGFEIDFAWVTRAWANPYAELKKYAPRILAIQLKDTAPPGTSSEGGWTPPGDGIVDWDALWPLFATTPADHLVVEHDNPADWRRVAQRAHDFVVSKGAKRND